MFSKTVLAFLLPALAAAQNYGAPPGPATTAAATTSAAATVPSAPADSTGHMNVDVTFGGSFVFHPANITAPVGTLVTFYFPAGSVAHSVTQSSFAAPCAYLAANSTANTPGGFDSGLVSASTFTINVTDTSPIWFHCKQVTHCGLGMVGSINAPTSGTNTFDAFVAAAKVQGANAPADTGPAVTGGVHGVATAAPSSDVGTTSGSGSSGSGSSDAVKVIASAGAAMLSAGFAVLMMA